MFGHCWSHSHRAFAAIAVLATSAVAPAQDNRSDSLPVAGRQSSPVVEPATQPADPIGSWIQPTAQSVPHGNGTSELRADSFWTRKTLFGDPWKLRAGLAENGVTITLFDITQISQGVASGGPGSPTAYGGHSDLVLLTDFSKLGGPKGLFLKIRGEGNFGQGLGNDAGVLLPTALQTQLPVGNDRKYAVTNFLFTQMFSKSMGVYVGKTDTLDIDTNAFASGRGKTQFLNSAFVVNAAPAQPIPYSTLVVGFTIVSPDQQPIFLFSILNPTDTTTTIGLDEWYAEGAIISSVLRLPTNFFGLPGHQLVAGLWNSRDAVSLNQDPRILLPLVGLRGAPIQRSSGSWVAFWNMDQYLFVDPNNEKRGWGFFARYGAADPDTNVVSHFASGGFGGSSILPRRKADTWGVGYYHTWVSESFLSRLAGLQNSQGIEAWYRAMITPYFDVTPDIQILDGALNAGNEWATILGVRANLRF